MDADAVASGKACPYCGEATKLVDSAVVYRRSYGPIYYCATDKAWVGVHAHTTVALGRLANYQLRELRKKAHGSFDRLWKSGQFSRKEAYAWLAQELMLMEYQTHIGLFDEKQCADTIEISDQMMRDLIRLDKDFGKDS